MNTTVISEPSFLQRYTPSSKNILFTSWIIFISALLIWGISISKYRYISAEDGLGYWLGIIGGSMMLLLLTYSLRKRAKSLRKLFSVQAWFRLHMIFGVVGPVLVIFHSNFRLGSLNSSVAFFSMLLVAGSGLIGRYFYNKIHYSLYGEKIKLGQLRTDFDQLNQTLTKYAVTEKQKSGLNKCNDIIEKAFQRFTQDASFFTQLSYRRKLHSELTFVRKFFHHLEHYHIETNTEAAAIADIQSQLHLHTSALLKIASRLPNLVIFEKLFSLWHVVHLPIFVLMLITATTHIVVVHMY